MLQTLKKAALTGVGLALMGKEKVEEVSTKIAKEANLSAEEGKKFVDDMVQEAEESRQKFDQEVQNKVKSTLEKMNITTKEDYDKLEKRVAKLEQELKKEDK
jgi:polyhydroxyalkanoate synthesis regulator phasin